MTLANRITLLRLLIGLSGFAVFWIDRRFGRLDAALLLFLLAATLDKVDGTVARRLKQASDVGRAFDTLTDKIVLGLFFLCLVELKAIPAMFVAAAVLRDVVVQGFRFEALSRGISIPTYGLSNTRYVVQIAAIVAGLLSASTWANIIGPETLRSIAWWLFVGGLVLGIASLANIFTKHLQEVAAQSRLGSSRSRRMRRWADLRSANHPG